MSDNDEDQNIINGELPRVSRTTTKNKVQITAKIKKLVKSLI
jgi:hypothetical protein